MRGIGKTFLLLTLTAVLLTTGCTRLLRPAATLDRSNAGSVLKGYFDAWDRNDWAGQASLMSEQYRRIEPEPVESVRVVRLTRLHSDASRSEFEVVFDIKVKGEGISMTSGRETWRYELEWDARKRSWLIVNYGGA